MDIDGEDRGEEVNWEGVGHGQVSSLTASGHPAVMGTWYTVSKCELQLLQLLVQTLPSNEWIW
jgi:hypothetical protein